MRTRRENSIESVYELPLLPLRELVIFPNTAVPLFIGRAKSIQAIEYAFRGDKLIFLSAQKDPKVDVPSLEDIYKVGTICKIVQLLRLPDGSLKILVEGLLRGRIINFLPNPDFYMVSVEVKTEVLESDVETQALFNLCKESFEEYANYNKKINPETVSSLLQVENPAEFSDRLSAVLPLPLEQKQKLLETISVKKRLESLLQFLRGELEVIKTEARIRERVKKQMEKHQRDYYLQEQMKAIQRELGEREDGKSELRELEKRIKKKKLPKHVSNVVWKEFKKLSLTPPMSAEATVIRNYIDWLLSLPWYEKTKDVIDLVKTEELLNREHYGLEKPKQRIIEHLAVQKLVDKIKGPILCFVGPPGVGKTSLAKSIAKALGRNFVRISLGGVRDEAEIRGHRRTYVGALPGKIIQGMKKAGTINPVFCLDEIDKIGTDFRGDPAAALLEVLDPEQNKEFVDHYIDVPFDISKVMFIATANTLEGIPVSLRDRLEIIEFSGYTHNEKLQIARNYLIPRQLKEHGIDKDKKNVIITDDAIIKIINEYTREAGVRNLEREIASLCRKIAVKLVEGEKEIKITEDNLVDFLDVPKYIDMKIEENSIGVATGLAWTEHGGEVLYIEAIETPGKGNISVTGRLGDIMKESVQIAFSYVKSVSKPSIKYLTSHDFHVHVPEGAIPKDGPSAGITIATALYSLVTKKPVIKGISMTGELTLTGRVLPIGGLKEKIIASYRQGIKKVIFPVGNKKDLSHIPNEIKNDMNLIPVSTMKEVIDMVIENEKKVKQKTKIL